MSSKISIALWGPKASGKTSLIYALGYTIIQKYQKGERGLYFLLSDMENRPISIATPDEISDIKMGTMGTHVTNLIFNRAPRTKPPSKSEQYSYLISSQEHYLSVFDFMGGPLMQLSESSRDSEVESVRIMLLSAESLLILLDPTMLREKSWILEDTPSLMTQSEYAHKINDLFNLLKEDDSKIRNVAVCIAKSDILDSGLVDYARMSDSNTWDVIKMIFGHEMYSVLQRFDKQISIRVFIVSSKKEKINKWDPDGVEWPFFWLFEEKERESITNRASGPTKDIFTTLFTVERLKYYIPYPRPSSERSIKI